MKQNESILFPWLEPPGDGNGDASSCTDTPNQTAGSLKHAPANFRAAQPLPVCSHTYTITEDEIGLNIVAVFYISTLFS